MLYPAELRARAAGSLAREAAVGDLSPARLDCDEFSFPDPEGRHRRRRQPGMVGSEWTRIQRVVPWSLAVLRDRLYQLDPASSLLLTP